MVGHAQVAASARQRRAYGSMPTHDPIRSSSASQTGLAQSRERGDQVVLGLVRARRVRRTADAAAGAGGPAARHDGQLAAHDADHVGGREAQLHELAGVEVESAAAAVIRPTRAASPARPRWHAIATAGASSHRNSAGVMLW